MSNIEVRLTEFSDLITRYTADFVGREWLMGQVEALLDDPDCRFVVLTGGPGVGKTAFLAHLAATHPQWLRYFIRRDSQDLLRPGDASTFLLTIGGQLATLYPHLFHPENLEVAVRQRIGSVEESGQAIGARIEELRASPFYRVALRVEQEIQQVAGKAAALEIGRLVSEPRLLQMQDLQYLGLLDPARLLAQENPAARIVVLVDALDELRYSPAEPDIVRALRELPEMSPNLRFVISSRPEVFLERLLARSDAHELRLDVAGTDNRTDLRTYAESVVGSKGWNSVLEREGLSPKAFVDVLLDKAAGNFLYLKSVLGGIQQAMDYPAKREQLSHLLRVEKLPGELGGLYGHFLQFIVEWAKEELGTAAWREYLRPFLGILAVAQEPLSEEQIIAFTDLKREDIHDLQRELRQFVEIVDGEKSVYRIYHASFAEYLLNEERNPDYWIDGQERHRHIADRYLNVWGGFEARLPGLQDPAKRDFDGGYGLRHLANHLAQAECKTDLWNLLVETPNWRRAQGIYDPSLRKYTRDIEKAMLLAEKQGIDGVPQAVAYNLLYATTVSQMTKVPSETLALMTSLGRIEQALKFAELRTRPELQAKAYIKISEELLLHGDIANSVEVLEQAQDVAIQITHLGSRGSALSKVAQVLNRAGRKEDAREVLSHALESITSETYGIGEAVINIAETAILLDDSDVLSRLLPIALDNKEEGSMSRGQFFCRLALILGKGGARDELIHYLELDPLSRLSESKAFTLAWIALGLTLVNETEIAERLFNRAQLLTKQKNDFLLPRQKGEDELELASVTAAVHLGEMTDPVDVLIRAKDLYDGRREHIQYDGWREHIYLYEDRQEFIFDEVVQLMIRNGNLERVRALTDLSSLLEFRVELLVCYAKESARLGNSDSAVEALRRALQAIDEYTERYYADWPNRVKRLRLVVNAIVQLGYAQMLEEALGVAERTEDYYGHTDYYARTMALATVAIAWVRCGNEKRAREVLPDLVQCPQSSGTFRSEASAWSEMMLVLANSGDAKRAQEAAQRTMECAEIIGDCHYVTDELSNLARGFSEIQDGQSLLDLLLCVRRIEIGDFSRGNILIEITQAMSQIGDRLGLVNVITAAANICEDASSYCTDAASFETLVGIAHILAKHGDVDGLLRVAATSRDLHERTTVFGHVNVMSTVGLALLRLGRFEIAEKMLSRVPWEEYVSRYGLRLGRNVPFAYNLSFYNIAQALALTCRLDQALKLTEYMQAYAIPELDTEIDKEYLVAKDGHPSRDETYVAIARAWLSQVELLPDQEDALRVAIETVAQIESTTNRFYGLIVLSRSLMRTGKQFQACEVLDVALQTADIIQNREKQAQAIITVGEILVQFDKIPRACDVLAQAEKLSKDIEDIEARVSILARLAETTIQLEEPDWAQEMISMLVPEILRRCGGKNTAFFLTCLADLYIHMDEFSLAREILSLASERTQGSQSEFDKIILLTKQSYVHCQIGDSELAQKFATSALDAFGRCALACGPLHSVFLDELVEPLFEVISICPQVSLVSGLLNAFQHARSRGRDKVLKHLGIFAPILGKLGIVAETWGRVQAVEAQLPFSH
jgi:tetratricopeptide (TPR) repeat protein